jgi:hypothetical protein
MVDRRCQKNSRRATVMSASRERSDADTTFLGGQPQGKEHSCSYALGKEREACGGKLVRGLISQT